MSRSINCPACGTRMKMFWIQSIFTKYEARYGCDCGLCGPVYYAPTRRGAAIRAGRAMRRIVEMVDHRIYRTLQGARRNGGLIGGRAIAQDIYGMLNDHRLTRAQIRERVRMVAYAL